MRGKIVTSNPFSLARDSIRSFSSGRIKTPILPNRFEG
jgi:hypothetical protein